MLSTSSSREINLIPIKSLNSAVSILIIDLASYSSMIMNSDFTKTYLKLKSYGPITQYFYDDYTQMNILIDRYSMYFVSSAFELV